MKKTISYYNTHFSSSIIGQAYSQFIQKNKQYAKDPIGFPTTVKVCIGNETWDHDSVEEFLSDYSKSESSIFNHSISETHSSFFLYSERKYTNVGIEFPKRSDIESIFQIFERNLETCKIQPVMPTIRVFIGHGHNDQWRDLKDHLHEKHGYEVNHYEIGPRAGTSVKEVLEHLLNSSSIAFLILTGEDLATDGTVHARENVIHEVGLFQGYLGFTKAIILKEDGVNEFSNILGINQIRFSKGNIKETFGDVVAIIKREFEVS